MADIKGVLLLFLLLLLLFDVAIFVMTIIADPPGASGKGLWFGI